MTGPTVSVVIRALNEEQHIGRLLTGLTRQTVTPDEIVLVDSGSHDSTVEIAARFGVKVVHIEPGEFSFGRSLNMGIAQTSGDLIVVPSAHVYPLYDTWIESLLQPFTDQEIALTYGRQVGDRVTKYSEHRILARWFPPVSQHRQGHPFCNNANAAIRRDVWEEQRYDESLTGLEDLDWARRALDEGFEVSYVAEAVVVHVHEETWRQIVNRYRREAIAHRRIFHEQHMSLWDVLRLSSLNILSDWWHAILDGALVENLIDIPRFRLAQFFGTYRGFNQRGQIPATLRRRFYYPTSPGERSRSIPAPGGRIDYGADRRGR